MPNLYRRRFKVIACRIKIGRSDTSWKHSLLLLQVGDLSNPELRTFTQQLDKIKYGGEKSDSITKPVYSGRYVARAG